MSFSIQRQIMKNAEDIKEYVTDLYDWEESMNQREKQKKTNLAAQNQYSIPAEPIKTQEDKPQIKQQSGEPTTKPKELVRDASTIASYYNAWDRFDIDKELQKLESDPKYRPYNPYEQNPNKVRAKPKAALQVSSNRVAPQLQDPTELKEKGNLFLKMGDYSKAVESYTQSLQRVGSEDSELRALLHSNRALAHMKNNETHLAIKDCDEAIRINPKYVKTYLRRAECRRKLGKLRQSLRDYQAILQIDPKEKDAKLESTKIQRLLSEKSKAYWQQMVIPIDHERRTGERISVEEVSCFEQETQAVDPLLEL